MNSQLTHDFLICFAKLPEIVKEQSRRCYKLWSQNPGHLSLHFKRIHDHENLFSVRIGLGYRALGLVQEDTISWFWIGSHAEYDTMIR